MMFERLANLAIRRSRSIIVAALLGAVVAGALSSGVADRLDPFGVDDPATESVKASDRLETAGHEELGLIVLVRSGPVDAPATRARVTRLADRLSREREVGRVLDAYSTRSPAFVSRDRRSTYLAVYLKPEGDKDRQEAAQRLDDRYGDLPGVTLGGPALFSKQINTQVKSDLRSAEMAAFPILLLLLLLFFRSIVAGVLPLVIGGLAIVGALLMLWLASHVTHLSIFALNLVTALGLGLAIDYSLFMVSRYREEIERSGPGPEAIRRTLATAGRTVLFSSLTVTVAMASLLLFPQRFLYSMGLGGAFVALIAGGLALVLLPSILVLLGERVNSLAPSFLQRRAARDARPSTSGFWYRLSRTVMRRPGTIAVVTAALLVALGIPFLGVRFTFIDAQVLPTTASARQVDDTLRADFPPFHDTPLELAVSHADPAETAAIGRRVEALPGVAAVAPAQPLRGGVSVIDVISSADTLSHRSQDLVREIRELPTDGAEVLVTGRTAHYVDLQSSLTGHIPRVLALMAIVTFGVLLLMTGSVVLPIKSLIMNFLTVSATFGILVLIFQDGRLESLLGYSSQGAIESTQPILLFAVVFGISTDYGVFLLGRIKEARDNGADDSEAVAIGLERSGRIVTSAALILCVAVGALVTSKIIFTKELGLGTAVAVLIDASLVRALLVPSLMKLLGRWNWWAPAPLRSRLGLRRL